MTFAGTLPGGGVTLFFTSAGKQLLASNHDQHRDSLLAFIWFFPLFKYSPRKRESLDLSAFSRIFFVDFFSRNYVVECPEVGILSRRLLLT